MTDKLKHESIQNFRVKFDQSSLTCKIARKNTYYVEDEYYKSFRFLWHQGKLKRTSQKQAMHKYRTEHMTVTSCDPTFCFHSTDTKARWENLFLHAKEADFLASDWLTLNGRRNFKLCSIHDQVYEARWFEHFLKKFSFLAIWYKTIQICGWLMSSRERESILPCFNSLSVHQIAYIGVLTGQKFTTKEKHRVATSYWLIEMS